VLAAIQAVRQTAESKGLLLKVEMLPVSALALGDEIRLEQVILNLLVNAVKYTEPGGEIRITGRLQEGEAEIEVTDTGAGIHPAFLEQIFQPFRRGATSRLSNQSGLGLGLSIARHIVEMHGGRIWAESRGVDAGSTFRVRLPLAALAPAETPKEHRLPQRAGETGHSRVLIIEDSADILFLLKIELEMLGHIVYTASDGERGWELAMTHRPDLIISDIKMPGLNGYDLIKKFKEAHELAAVPVIALTGLGGKADIERAIEAGFDACITKPAEPYEISALIKKLSESRATQI
jgi:CheY-like chemotaxis protein